MKEVTYLAVIAITADCNMQYIWVSRFDAIRESGYSDYLRRSKLLFISDLIGFYISFVVLVSLPGSYYPLIGYKQLDENRWYRDTDHYLKVKASEYTKPKPIDAPPILPDKVSSLLERAATDKEKRRRKKRFFKKVGK